MTNNADRKKKKMLPYWAALLLSLIGCAITANVLTIALQMGVFNAWASLPAAPAGAEQIIDADETNVWVKTGNGSIFWFELYCIGKNTCGQWVPVRSASDIKAYHVVELQRGQHCPKSAAGLFPLDPAGRMAECVWVAYPGPEMGSDTYYALMADGVVKLWRNSNSLIAQTAYFFLSTVIVPVIVAVIISALYLGIHIGRRQQAESEHPAPLQI